MNVRRCAARAVALVALGSTFAAAPLAAQGAWNVSGAAAGPGIAQTASQVTPTVTVTGCTWSSATRVLTATVSWTKSAYATSTVVRTPALGVPTTVATGLASPVTTYAGAVPITIGTGNNATGTTAAYTFSVTAGAGLHWARTGTSPVHSFTATSSKGKTPDRCVVL